MLPPIFSTLSFGLQIIITFYNWFINPLHPLVFMSINSILAILVYLSGLNRYIMDIYKNFRIQIPTNKLTHFNLIYLLKFVLTFFLGSYLFEFVKWIFISLEYLAIAFVSPSPQYGYFLMPFTSRETFWLFPVCILCVILETISETLLKKEKESLEIDDVTEKRMAIIEKYIWEVVLGMGFTIYFFGSVYFLIISKLRHKSITSLDDKIVLDTLEIFETNAYHTLEISSYIFMLSLLWIPFFSPVNTKEIIFIIILLLPCLLFIIEVTFKLPQKYNLNRKYILKSSFSISMLLGSLFIFIEPEALPLFRYINTKLFAKMQWAYLNFYDIFITFNSIFTSICAWYFCYLGVIIWRDHRFTAIMKKDPFLYFYKDKIEMFVFSLGLRIIFFSLSFYNSIPSDELLNLTLKKFLLGAAMVIPVTAIGNIDRPVYEINKYYTQNQIVVSFNQHRKALMSQC